MQDDAELLRDYVENGSEEAFTELVRRHLNLVYSAALRRVGGDAHLAQDVAQQVFVALARQSRGLIGRKVLAGWLYTASRFASARVARTERRRHEREREACFMNENPEHNPDWDRLRAVLDGAMDKLGTLDREALLLRFFEGKSFADVSARLNVTDEAARKRVNRASEKLRLILAGRGIASTAAAVATLIETHAVAAAPPSLAQLVAGNALAVTGGFTSSALNILHLMTKTKLSIGVATILTVAAVGTATHAVRASLQAQRLLNAANMSNAVLSRKVQEMGQSAQAADQDRAAAEKSLAAVRQSRAAADTLAAGTAAGAGAATRDPKAAGRALVAANPQAAQFATDYFRARAADVYSSLFKTLGLSPDKIQRFEDLMVQGTGGVAWSSATQWPEGEIAIGEMSREEMESQLHSLLGDPGFSQYQDYDGSRAARMVASQLGSSLYLTDAPLTTDQASQVTAIVNASGINSGSPDWDGAISKAKDVLSGTQVAALSGLRQEWQYKQALDQAIDQAMEQATNQAKQASGIGTVPATVAR